VIFGTTIESKQFQRVISAVQQAYPVEGTKEFDSSQRMAITYITNPNLSGSEQTKIFLNLVELLDDHPEYEPVVKRLARSLSDNEKTRLNVQEAVFKYGLFDEHFRDWVPENIYDVPKFFPPLMIRWVKFWTGIEGQVPEFITRQTESGFDGEEILMMLVRDAVQTGRLTMWCNLDVDGAPHDAWRYKVTVGTSYFVKMMIK
jgi:hypothetical protein